MNPIFLEHVVTNLDHMHVNVGHAQDIKTRESVSCIIAVICGVSVHWIRAKRTCVAAHSSDVEIRAFYTTIKFNKYLQYVVYHLRHDIP